VQTALLSHAVQYLAQQSLKSLLQATPFSLQEQTPFVSFMRAVLKQLVQVVRHKNLEQVLQPVSQFLHVPQKFEY